MTTRRIHLGHAFFLGALVALGVTGNAGCAGPNATNGPPVAPLPVDSDPIALLPRGAVGVAWLDARTFYASGAVGAQVAMLTEKLVPVGQDAGLSAARDVDRVLVGLYATGGFDATAILTGRFDVARVQAAGEARLTTRGGSFTALPYGGHVVYAAAGTAFVVLSDHTLIAGSEPGVRRILDRLAFLHDAHPQREIPGWMIEALESPGAALVVALDSSGLPPGMFQSLPVPMTWTSGLTTTRIIANFHDPGMNVAGTMTYADPPHAVAGADSLRQLASIVSAAAALGVAPRIQNLTIVPNGTNVESKFVVDEQAMKSSIATLIQWLGGGRPHA